MNTIRRIFVATAGAVVLAATAGCSSGGAGDAASTKAPSSPATTTTATSTSAASAPSSSSSQSGTGPSSTATSVSTSTSPSSTTSTRTQTTPATSLPTLGLKGWGSGVHTFGFGYVRPNVINNGGDPTGVVQSVTWSTWGGQTADGNGMGFFVPADQAVAGGMRVPARIRAYDLGTCGGHPAYRHVIWWFPSKGETYKSARARGDEPYNLCTGN